MPKLIDRYGQRIVRDALASAPGVSFPEEWCGTKDGVVLQLANDFPVASLPAEVLQLCAGVRLDFPQFTDGRAYSQARALRERGFSGEIRASGEVLVDQLLAMRRCGFSSFELAADQTLEDAQRALQCFDVAAQATINDEALRLRRWEPDAPVNMSKVA